MNEFFEWLEKANEQDTRVRAVLRRSLAFDPGCFPSAFSYVEPFLKDTDSHWRREVFYLTAGLWAANLRDRHVGPTLTLGKAAAAYQLSSGSSSIERRFIALLDADADQLAHRLRQMLALLKDYSVDFGALLQDLLRWNDESKRTQNAWARDFYRHFNNETDHETSEPENAA